MESLMTTIRILGPGDAAVLDRVADDVFDDPVDPRWTAEFLADSRHHLAVALDGCMVVGMASGVRYVHPDKPPELWVNEVGVSPTHRGRGIGRRLLEALLERGRSLGCRQAWVGTESTNTPARRLYAAAGGVESHEAFIMVEFDLGHERSG
jgi:ribosomal protein S18 acetylase RimI-like enzyme